MPRYTAKTLLEIAIKEMAKGRIYERPIVGSKRHIEGLCNWVNGEVSVNPAPSVVDTLIHELLHRRFRRWSEARVLAETWRVMETMTPDAVQALHRQYKRIAKRRRKAVYLKNPKA
jgi:hypothetical protein